MSLSFKQYHDFLSKIVDQSEEAHEAILNSLTEESDKEKVDRYNMLLGSKDAKVRAAAEQGLALMVKKGNNLAKQVQARWERVKAQRNVDADAKVAQAKAHAEVADRGSSHAYDRETGSARRTQPYWDRRLNRWVKPGEGPWDHVGKHD